MALNSSHTLSLRDRRLWLPFLLLMIVAVVFRFAPLSHEALSGDEIFSRRIVVESSLRGWQDIRQDLVHPPLYYIFLKMTTKLWGAGALGIRMLSLICGLLTPPVLVVLGNKLPRARWSGLLAACCVAVGQATLFYSQEARSYAMYTLIVLLLALWIANLSQTTHSAGYWVLGCSLMTLLVYTHYVGGIFLLLAVATLLCSRLSNAVRLRVVSCGLVTLALFLPWLYGEIGVYRAKNGIGENLNWQGHPAFYDLRQVWATALGVNNFRGATMLAFLLLILLSSAALVHLAHRGELRQTPLVLGLASMGWLTPLLVFVLSKPPINLPLFALRHVLPATVLLTLLSAYGLELLATHYAAYKTALMLTGSLCLILFAAAPTLQLLHAGPSRYPYDQIERFVVAKELSGIQSYAVWYYGVAEPINFYCQRTCVQKLPDSDDALPMRLVLLYRPSSQGERGVYKRLLDEGYSQDGETYFTDGMYSPSGTTATVMVRGGLIRSGGDGARRSSR